MVTSPVDASSTNVPPQMGKKGDCTPTNCVVGCYLAEEGNIA